MRYALLLIAAVAWGLWFGGTIATFVFGLYFFHHLPRDVFGAAAHAMFAVFANYQLIVAAVALGAAGLAMVTYPSKGTVTLLAGFLAAGVTALVFGVALLPMMEGFRRQGMDASPEFLKLHGASMATMTLQAAILLGTGAVLLACRGTGYPARVPSSSGVPRVPAQPVGGEPV